MTLAVDLVASLALSRRSRATLVAILSLLLLGMQQEGLRHALSHWGSRAPQQTVLTAATDAPCIQCALLAAGSAAITGDAPVIAGPTPADRATTPVHASPALVPPRYYFSRAPPPLS